MASQPSHPDQPSEDEIQDDLEPSKSQRKRDADDIRDFARALTVLPPRKLKRLALPPDIEEAIKKCPAPSTRGAHKRQLQFISKLLRKNGDVEEIKSRLENPVAPTNNEQPHKEMRDNLITDFAEHAESFRVLYPTANLQKVRQLVRQANAATVANDDEDENEVDQSTQRKADKARKSLLTLLRESAQA